MNSKEIEAEETYECPMYETIPLDTEYYEVPQRGQ